MGVTALKLSKRDCKWMADVLGLGLNVSQRRTRLGRDADEIWIDSDRRGKALERGTELGEPGTHGAALDRRRRGPHFAHSACIGEGDP
jgi:hypothetical protein